MTSWLRMLTFSVLCLLSPHMHPLPLLLSGRQVPRQSSGHQASRQEVPHVSGDVLALGLRQLPSAPVHAELYHQAVQRPVPLTSLYGSRRYFPYCCVNQRRGHL
mmetsp:Transcript_28829/g.63519  ORF Transcript_28829/g.63519 Transcript_28829/m.63519 type:complete len:104 (-) Transcript_28829:540-851(-)